VCCWQVLKELCAKCDEACVNNKNAAGRTALHIASLMGLVEAAKVLLSHRAKVAHIVTSSDNSITITNRL